jgi:hypothetical protein
MGWVFPTQENTGMMVCLADVELEFLQWTVLSLPLTSAGPLFRPGRISCSFLHRIDSNLCTCTLLNVLYKFQVFFL